MVRAIGHVEEVEHSDGGAPALSCKAWKWEV